MPNNCFRKRLIWSKKSIESNLWRYDILNFTRRTVAGDEYFIQINQQSSEWHFENVEKQNPKSRSKIKLLLTVFFNYRNVEHSEFFLKGMSLCGRQEAFVPKRVKFVEGQFTNFVPRWYKIALSHCCKKVLTKNSKNDYDETILCQLGP